MNAFAIALLVCYGIQIAAAIVVMTVGEERETIVVKPKQRAVVTFFSGIIGLLVFLAAIGIL